MLDSAGNVVKEDPEMRTVVRLGELRTIKSSMYRNLVELCMLLENGQETHNVGKVVQAFNKAKEMLVEIRKEP